jgi:hypothetical protein
MSYFLSSLFMNDSLPPQMKNLYPVSDNATILYPPLSNIESLASIFNGIDVHSLVSQELIRN